MYVGKWKGNGNYYLHRGCISWSSTCWRAFRCVRERVCWCRKLWFRKEIIIYIGGVFFYPQRVGGSFAVDLLFYPECALSLVLSLSRARALSLSLPLSLQPSLSLVFGEPVSFSGCLHELVVSSCFSAWTLIPGPKPWTWNRLALNPKPSSRLLGD